MTAKLTTKIISVTNRVDAAFIAVGLTESGQHGISFIAKTSGTDAGKVALILKGCATANKPAATDKVAKCAAAVTGGADAQIVFSNVSATPALGVGKTQTAQW